MVLEILSLFQEKYNYSEESSRTIVWLIFFIPGILAGLISYLVSNYIDNQIYKAEVKPDDEENFRRIEKKQARRESAVFSLKILGLMILVVFIIFLLQ